MEIFGDFEDFSKTEPGHLAEPKTRGWPNPSAAPGELFL